MLDKKNTDGLVAIAELAITIDELERDRKLKGTDLGNAYEDWKLERGIDHVERDTEEWTAMLSATKLWYEQWTEAKRQEKNARRRLVTAIRRHREGRVA